MPSNKQSNVTYEAREKVLCYHGELIYEAKVLEIKPNDPKDKKAGSQYFVHYNGWKNT